jgi:hypothetical protein
MSFVQRLVTAVVPRAWARAMEAESRTWMARCEVCREESSIWDRGGIRWMAAGNPRRRLACPRCASVTWHEIRRP